VVVADIEEDAGRGAANEIGGTFVAADVTKDADIEALVADADILVNNAGGYDEPVFPDAPLAHWSRALDLNLRAAMLGIHYAVRAMERRGGGAIVNIASTAGLGFGPHPGPEYAASKAGLMRLTVCLAPLAERGIRVNCVCPNTVGTEAVRRTIAEVKARGDELPLPLQATLLEPEEVADAVLALVHDDSLAGRVIVLYGGEPPQIMPVEGSRSLVLASLAEVIEELARPPTRNERKNGWLEETRSEVAAHLRAIRDDVEGEMPPHPRDLPSQVDAVRWLDAMGISLGDPLTDRVMDAFAAARRFANRAR
jgi:3-oxoacyl-[acyl-carrier protein] reductase